jgi:hypothetical protein
MECGSWRPLTTSVVQAAEHFRKNTIIYRHCEKHGAIFLEICQVLSGCSLKAFVRPWPFAKADAAHKTHRRAGTVIVAAAAQHLLRTPGRTPAARRPAPSETK